METDLDQVSIFEAAACQAYIYDIEVRNGGHIQFFVNHGVAFAEETLSGLHIFGAHAFVPILTQALAVWKSHRLPEGPGWRGDLEEFSALYKRYGKDFEPLDDKFYDLKPELVDLLEAHLQAHQSDLVKFV